MKPTQGFQNLNLTTQAKLILEAFTNQYECVTPQAAVKYAMTKQQSYKALKELRDKDLIVFGSPYRLTKKGIRYIQSSKTIINEKV